MDPQGSCPGPLSTEGSAAAAGRRAGRALRALFERPLGRYLAAALAGLVAFIATVALTWVRRVPEGWVAVRIADRALLRPGERYLAWRAAAVALFPLEVDLQAAPIQVRAAAGESLRGSLALRGRLAPEAALELVGAETGQEGAGSGPEEAESGRPASPASLLQPRERARDAVFEAVERVLAAREARQLVDSSPFGLETGWLPVGGVSQGLEVHSSEVDLVSVESLRAVGAGLHRSGGSAAVEAFLSALEARRGRLAATLCVRGDLARLEGDSTRAEALYLATLDVDPTLPAAMEALLAQVQQGGEGLARVERLLRRALAARPESLPHLNWLSLVLARRGDMQGAQGAAVRALSIAPGDATAAINLAALMDRQGRRGEAIQQLRRVLERHPDHPLALYNLGSALAEQGDMDGALAAFERAERVSAPSVRLLSRMALAYEKQGDLRKAEEYRQRADTLRRSRQAEAGGEEPTLR